MKKKHCSASLLEKAPENWGSSHGLNSYTLRTGIIRSMRLFRSSLLPSSLSQR
uniref:Uncharacterized protein n=1 Tax=Rhizophora mucronata TaxID=61149 RepID=A0A2P2P882_RHIMU